MAGKSERQLRGVRDNENLNETNVVEDGRAKRVQPGALAESRRTGGAGCPVEGSWQGEDAGRIKIIYKYQHQD